MGINVRPGSPQAQNARLTTSTGKSVPVNSMAQPHFQGFIRDLEARGYKINDLGGYDRRFIRGSRMPSQHYYGNAIDINPRQNSGGRYNLPSDVAALAAKHGLFWGGNWQHPYTDSMHFEWSGAGADQQTQTAGRPLYNQATPGELEQLQGQGGAGPPPDAGPPDAGPNQFLRRPPYGTRMQPVPPEWTPGGALGDAPQRPTTPGLDRALPQVPPGWSSSSDLQRFARQAGGEESNVHLQPAYPGGPLIPMLDDDPNVQPIDPRTDSGRKAIEATRQMGGGATPQFEQQFRPSTNVSAGPAGTFENWARQNPWDLQQNVSRYWYGNTQGLPPLNDPMVSSLYTAPAKPGMRGPVLAPGAEVPQDLKAISRAINEDYINSVLQSLAGQNP